MVINIKKVLEDMGWSDGFYIPVANVENLKLEAEIERLTTQKVKLGLQSETLNSKYIALEKHFKHVCVEQEENQNLLFARQRQLEEEKNFYILAKMEKERLSADTKKLEKEFELVTSRTQTKSKDLLAMNSKLEKLKSSIEWDENSIETWTQMLLKRYEDNEIIRKFSEEDKRKAKELEIKRLHLQEEETERKQLVIRTSKEIESLELIVMRNVQVYKQLYEERTSLVQQWEASIEHLQQRDLDTLNANREVLGVRELIETKRESLAEQQQFQRNEINNNKEMESQIEAGHAEVAKMRKDLANCAKILQTYTSEFEVMKRELQRSAEMLQKERIAIKNCEKEHVQKKEIVGKMIAKVQQLREKRKSVEEAMLSANDRVRALEELGKQEEIREKGIVVDLEQMTSQLSRGLKIHGELMIFYKLQTVTIQGLEQGLITLEKKKQELEKYVLVKREAYYKISYKLAILMSKLTRLSRVSGNASAASENEELQAKIVELEEKCSESVRLYNIMNEDINRLEDVMRHLTASIFQDKDKMLNMKDKLQDQILLVEGALKMLHANKTLAQQHQVDENVLKVRLNHADNMLKQEGSNIYNLHKQQLQLETMMKERESDILIHKDMLISKRSALTEDTNRLKLDIQSRRTKTDIYKKRMDAVLSSIGRTEDGSSMTVSYFKLKNAQEKYMLQDEGDKLDGLIKTAETEIIALENTLKAVNICNAAYKKNVSMIEEEDVEAKMLKGVEKELFDHTKLLRKTRTKFENQQTKLIDIQKLIEEKEEKIAEFNVSKHETENEYKRLVQERQHRAEKRHRAEKQIKKVVFANKKMDEILIQDFVTSQLQDFNKTALVHLQEMCKKYEDTTDTIKKYLAEKDVALTISSSIKSSSRSCSSISYDSVRSADVESDG